MDRMTTPTLGSFLRERERERVLENGRAAGIAVKGPVARTQAIPFTERAD